MIPTRRALRCYGFPATVVRIQTAHVLYVSLPRRRNASSRTLSRRSGERSNPQNLVLPLPFFSMAHKNAQLAFVTFCALILSCNSSQPVLRCGHTNICIAIDGSERLSADEFVLQKEFVKLLIATFSVDQGPRYTVTQYGLEPQVTFPLTSYRDDLLFTIHNLTSLHHHSAHVAVGLASCMRQLPKNSLEPNKIILLHDMRNVDGYESRKPFLPMLLSSKFRREANNTLSAVGVNFGDDQQIELLENIVGDASKVFKTENWFGAFELVDRIVESVCPSQDR